MERRTIERLQSCTIFKSPIGTDQIHITLSVTDPQAQAPELFSTSYNAIITDLAHSGMQVVFERYFGSNELMSPLVQQRRQVLSAHGMPADLPLTYVQGRPLWGQGFAGLQLRAARTRNPKDVWTIYDQDQAVGRGWKLNGSTFIMLQNIHGFDADPSADNSRSLQTSRMFERINRLLIGQGGSYKNIVRTWIYLSKILDWYDEFNKVRNAKYSEFKLLFDADSQPVAEKIYLPASTGIEGDNPIGAAGVVDALAVLQDPQSDVQIAQTSGVKQKSAFRYGSAFSRAMSIREPRLTQVLVSGTASIDEQGHSVYFDDMRGQVMKTVDVFNALIAHEGASMQDIYDATVFIKKPADVQTFRQVAGELGLNDMPAVYVLADVCRDELLFELDAAVSLENGKR
jgi:enamine deaminase RidA (YjgF/YER057c/UK114 family)